MPAKGQDIHVPRSIFLAKLIGPLFVAIGVGMLVNQAVYQAIAVEALRSYALIYLSGLLVLLGGLSIVILHNVWAPDWRVIITVLGWLGVIGGLVRIVLPQLTQSIGAAVFPRQAIFVVAALVVLVLGGFLSFKGYH